MLDEKPCNMKSKHSGVKLQKLTEVLNLTEDFLGDIFHRGEIHQGTAAMKKGN